MSDQQSPAYFKITVGGVTVTSVSDGVAPFPMDQLLKDSSPQAADAELRASFVQESYPTSINTFLLELAGKVVLLDTGAGQTLGAALGQLPVNLKAAGYTTDQVTDVVLSHLHMDHDGGLTQGKDLVFPNATLHVNKRDVDAWLAPEAANRAQNESKADPKDPKKKFTVKNYQDTQAALAPYQHAGRLRSFSDNTELFPGLQAITAPGHTPGHTMFHLESDGASLMFWGDTVHVAEVQIANPEVTILFDSDPQEAARRRKKVLQCVTEERKLIAGSYLPFPGIGHIRLTNGKYIYVPLDYQTNYVVPKS